MGKRILQETQRVTAIRLISNWIESGKIETRTMTDHFSIDR